MFTNITKMIIPTLFISITSQALSNYGYNYQDYIEFDMDKINKIKFQVDVSAISFYTSDSDKFQLYRERIRGINNNSHLSWEINDSVLNIYSNNRGRGGCEVNYEIRLPKAVDVEIDAGTAEIDSNAIFKSMSLLVHRIKGKFHNPNCNMDILTFTTELDITYDRILDTHVNLDAKISKGQINLKLPDQATVGYQYNTACKYLNHMQSKFYNTKDNPNFNITFLTTFDAGRLNIFKHVKCL